SNIKMFKLLGFFLLVILDCGKPVSLTYRCPCRFYESNVAKANIKHLKILTMPNCSLQIVARLKNNSKQVCIDPKIKWIQEYLEKHTPWGPISRALKCSSPAEKNKGTVNLSH
uniref:Stromal cell-derived factor 1 n=1 Tax=Sphenodon punctatus TaxID=8508 RepID=A0A8D0GQX0_SPHPU